MLVNSEKICALDIETTGLSIPSSRKAAYDEILQLAVISIDGQVQFNEYFKPERHESWLEAENCNGISYDMVKRNHTFHEKLSDIQEILDRYDLVIVYNADFDLSFIGHQGVNFKDKHYFCMMKAFSRLRSKRGLSPKRLRRYSLAQCASFLNVCVNDKEHDALADAQTVLSCYQAMCRMLNVNEQEVLTV